MRKRLVVLAGAVLLGVFLTGCDRSSPAAPSTSDPAPAVTNTGRGGGLTLPKNAPPRVRKAVEKAQSAEDERDRIQAEALEIIREHPPPDVPVATTPGDPAGSSEPCADTACDSSAECVSGCPSLPPPETNPQPPVQAQPAPPPTVPPEVRQAMNAWAQAQRERIQACENAAAEVQASENSEIGTSTSPLCSADRLPEDFKKWLAILGYNVNDLIYRGV